MKILKKSIGSCQKVENAEYVGDDMSNSKLAE